MEDKDSGQVSSRSSIAGDNNSSQLDRKGTSSSSSSVSQIEKSVTHLLVATKQLLEILTQWSRGAASETQVSDVYVRLGYEFNIACRTFGTIGVDCKDLGPVPDLLRSILEETLSQEASQASLDRYLPRIRDIIINLLHGLKRKQQKLRQRSTKDVGTSSAGSRTSSRNTVGSNDAISSPSTYPDDRDHRISRSTSERDSDTSSPARQISQVDNEIARTTSMLGREADQQRQTTIPEEAPPNPVQDAPQIPYPSGDTIPAPEEPSRPSRALNYGMESSLPQQDALTALQHGGSLERRASRRFSQYQIQKQLGANSSAMPIMPPSQHSPIPNRGRDPRQSIHTNRVRPPVSREISTNTIGSDSFFQKETSPNRHSARIAEAPSSETALPSSPPIPTIKGPHEESHFTDNPPLDQENIRFSSNITNVGTDEPSGPIISPTEESEDLQTPIASEISKEKDSQGQAFAAELPESQTQLASQPLTLFLQYKNRVKKLVLDGGYDELTMARLQLAFIEKFAWNAHGVDLPEIYLQDPVSNVRYELENLLDVKNNTVLVLNVDDLDEVKRHVDDSMNGLRRLVEGVRTALDDQQAALQRVSERQQDAAKDMARFTLTPPTPPPTSGGISSDMPAASKNTAAKIAEVQSLRRELAVMRQTYTSHMSNMEAQMSSVRTKAAAVKQVASKASTASIEGAGGREYVDSSKKTLNEDSEKLIGHVDDLQDTVEDLRKDVTRGVRPLPRQLEAVSKDIAAATEELKKLKEFLAKEKPVWQKVGEYELAAVMDDQNAIKMQEELAGDLEDDLEKASQTFSLVEQASKQQNLANGSASRSSSRTIATGDVDPQTARDGVLGEVKALQPNHETRLEAIHRAEKARQLELASRREGEFKKELGSFVEEGKLKKSGGIEEVERLRKVREEQARRGVWEGQSAQSVVSEYQPPAQSSDQQSNSASTAAPATATSPSGAPKLDLPLFDTSSLSADSNDPGSISPEPEFVEAHEEVLT